MLHEFLQSNREELIKQCKIKVDSRRPFNTNDTQLDNGIPRFIDQLITALRAEQTDIPIESRSVVGPTNAVPPLSDITGTAIRHGRELLQRGFTIEQVVHDYGDLCQAVTELAFARGVLLKMREFRTLNRCLDNAIADAVTEFSYLQNARIAEQGTLALNERLGFLAHELRNRIHTASLALMAIKSGNVGLAGPTGAVLERSLVELRSLVDRSLADVRMTAELPTRHQLISVADFIDKQKISARLEAHTRECTLCVSSVDPKLAVEVDRDLLSSAVGNLLQNAFKFTHRHTDVSLNAFAANDRIMLEVADQCGGLSPGHVEELFKPFVQNGEDKSGLGLGLSISRRSVAANRGVLTVRNLPGRGCVFRIDLPRYSMPTSADHDAS